MIEIAMDTPTAQLLSETLKTLLTEDMDTDTRSHLVSVFCSLQSRLERIPDTGAFDEKPKKPEGPGLTSRGWVRTK